MSRIRSTKSNVANLAKALCTSSAMVVALASGAVGLSANEAAAQWTCVGTGGTYTVGGLTPGPSTIAQDQVVVNSECAGAITLGTGTIDITGSMIIDPTAQYTNAATQPGIFQQNFGPNALSGNFTYNVNAGVELNSVNAIATRTTGGPQAVVAFNIYEGTINNSGTIRSSAQTIISRSILNGTVLNVNNSSTGIISSDGFVAIIPNSSVNTITNDGLIEGFPASFEIRRHQNNVNNSATGILRGVQSGLSVRLDPDSAVINNSGLIQATGTDGIGIKIGVTTMPTDLVINNTGTIEGGAPGPGNRRIAIYAATGSGEGVNIVNSGTINGDVLLSQGLPSGNVYNPIGNQPIPIDPTTNLPYVGFATSITVNYPAASATTAGNDTLEIRPGSNITGIVDAGIGNDTFILGGAGVATINAGEFDGDGIFTPPPGGAERYTGFENHFKRGSSQWIMTGTNGETGLWQVQDGELTVDATMGGWAMDVSNATLSGTGTVGDTTIDSGGIIAPGNPSGLIANFNVNGDLTFENGSQYRYTIDENDSDVIRVTGDVQINGGDVDVQAIPNASATEFGLRQQYDIITTTNGTVTGTFASAPQGNVPLSPLSNYTYQYSSNAVSLVLDQTIIINPPPPGQPLAFNLDCNYLRTFRPFTFNQCQAALGLTGFNFSLDLDVYNNLAELTADRLAEALDALTGEIHSESAKAGAEITKEFDELLMAISVNRRGNSTINEVLLGAPGAASTAYGADLDPQLAPVIDEDDYNKLWFGGLGAHVQIDEDGNAGGPLVNTYGLGGGVHMNHTWWGKGTLGVAAGYTRSTVNIQNRYQSSDIDTAHIGIYGSGGADRLEEGFAARGAASYAYHWVDTVRDIEFGNSIFVAPIDRTAKANYTGQTVSADIEAKYNFLFETDNFGTAALSPYVRATIQRTKFSRFQEEGARFINLSGQAETYTPATVAVGAMLTGEYEFDKGWIWRPSAALAYEHYFHGGDVFTGLDYDGSTQPFLVAGAAESSHRIRFSTMSDLAINDRFSLTFATDNVFNSDRFDVSAKAGLKISF